MKKRTDRPMQLALLLVAAALSERSRRSGALAPAAIDAVKQPYSISDSSHIVHCIIEGKSVPRS